MSSAIVTCRACEFRVEYQMDAGYPGTERMLSRDSWGRTKYGHRLCPVCSLTPERSAALIALRDGSGPER